MFVGDRIPTKKGCTCGLKRKEEVEEEEEEEEHAALLLLLLLLSEVYLLHSEYSNFV